MAYNCCSPNKMCDPNGYVECCELPNCAPNTYCEPNSCFNNTNCPNEKCFTNELCEDCCNLNRATESCNVDNNTVECTWTEADDMESNCDEENCPENENEEKETANPKDDVDFVPGVDIDCSVTHLDVRR